MEKKSKNFSLNFYKNKKVLITGANGFKGFWLSLMLLNVGANVGGIGIRGKDFKILEKLSLEKNISFKFLNINNIIKLKKFIKIFKPDIIFHLASESLVYNCHINPIKALKTNIIGLANLLISIKELNYKKELSLNIITSDKCYLPQKKKSFKENDRLGGFDIYSSTKACQEILTQSFYRSFFKSNDKIFINTLRAGNVIGGGDYSDNRLIPDIYKSLKLNSKLFIRNKNSTRPWQHVLDTLHGYLLAAEYSSRNKKNFSSWNFSPNTTSYRVIDILNNLIINKYIKKRNIIYRKNKINETKYLELNSKKANRVLRWKSLYSFNKIIEDSFEVYKILDAKINKKKKYKILKKRVQTFLIEIYGDSYRSK